MALENAKSRKWLWLAAAILVAGALLPLALYMPRSRAASQASPAAPKETKPDTGSVACLGRIEPLNGVIRVAAPYLFGRPSLVKELHVKEGQKVRSGELLAVLDGRDQLRAGLDQAQARIAVARSRLAQVKAGAKGADISAQRSEIGRLEANLANARVEFKRYSQLRQTDDVTASDLDAKHTAVVTAEHELEAARAKLTSLSEVRPADVEMAEAELRSAVADEAHARSEYESSAVYAPITGQVIQIHARAGEEPGASGILELGQTDRMYAVAEVYETDIRRVRPGQRATVVSDLLPHPVEGTVERIGMKVTQSAVLPGDPAAFADNRVIPVKIRLEDSAAVAGLINGKVSVVIHQ